MLSGLNEIFDDLVNGRLVARLGPRFVRQYNNGYRLVWPSGRTLTRPMQKFREWVLEERDDYITQASALLGVKLRYTNGPSR